MAPHDEPTNTVGERQSIEKIQVESATLQSPVSNQIATDREDDENASDHAPRKETSPTRPSLENAARNIDTLKRNIEIHKRRNQKLARRVEELEGHKDEMDAQCERLEKERAALEKERDECMARLDTQGVMQKEIDTLRSELGATENARKGAAEDRARMEGELAQSNSARAALSVRTSAAEARAVAAEARAGDAEGRAKHALVRTAEAEGCVLAARTQASEAQACTSAAEARASACEDRIVLAEKRTTVAETRAAAIADELRIARDALEAAERQASLQASRAITEKQELLRSLQVQSTKLSRIEDELAKATDELARAHMEIGKVKDTLAGKEVERLEMQADFTDLRDRFSKFSCRLGFSSLAPSDNSLPPQPPQSAPIEASLSASTLAPFTTGQASPTASVHTDNQQPTSDGASALSRQETQSGSSGEKEKPFPAKQARKRPRSPSTAASGSEGTALSTFERPRVQRKRVTSASATSSSSRTSPSDKRSGSSRRATRDSAKPVAWEMLKPR
ncbi:hypothetical protein EV715DRAFT_268593, partial [Schizophyllum commune]